MYGYLKYNKQFRNYDIYKRYYCGLCLALKKNYGLKATLYLNYEMVFIALLLSNCTAPPPITKCSVSMKKKNIPKCFSNDYWKTLATATLVLAYAKIVDNQLDQPSAKNKLLGRVAKKIGIKKHKENIEIFEYVDLTMSQLASCESVLGIEGQTEKTFVLVLKALSMFYSGENAHLNQILRATIKWLCIIDAIDDYDEDLKHDRFNPFLYQSNEKTDFDTFFENNYQIIAKYHYDLLNILNNHLDNVSARQEEKCILHDIVNKLMPQSFFFALAKENKSKK